MKLSIPIALLLLVGSVVAQTVSGPAGVSVDVELHAYDGPAILQ